VHPKLWRHIICLLLLLLLLLLQMPVGQLLP
jgi:hypothetical protein